MAWSVEDIERYVQGQLSITLPAHLQATADRYLAQDRADGLVDDDGASRVLLLAPEHWYLGGTNIVTRYPSVEVAVPADDISGFSLGQFDADVEVSLVVQAWVQHADFDVLNPLVKRYTAAVSAAIIDPNTLPDFSVERVRRAWMTNPETTESDPRVKGAGLCVFTLRGSWQRP